MPLTRNRNIEHWDAEDVEAWEAGGKEIAKRNLIWSISPSTSASRSGRSGR